MKLIPQYNPIFDRQDLQRAMTSYVLGNGFFTEYRETAEFERSIEEELGVKHCVTMNNGTITLVLILRAWGIQPGDRVICPNLTMPATANAIHLLGAVPVLVDVNPDTLCIDHEKLPPASEINADALIYVTFNGRSGNYQEVREYVVFCGKSFL